MACLAYQVSHSTISRGGVRLHQPFLTETVTKTLMRFIALITPVLDPYPDSCYDRGAGSLNIAVVVRMRLLPISNARSYRLASFILEIKCFASFSGRLTHL